MSFGAVMITAKCAKCGSALQATADYTRQGYILVAPCATCIDRAGAAPAISFAKAAA